MARNLVEILVKLLKTGTGAQEAEKELTGLDKAVKVAGAAMAAFATREVAEAVFELGKLGAESLRTRSSFEAISGSATQAATRLDAMKRATRGALSEQAAMSSANRLMQMGLATNADELENVTQMAVRLGTAMGRDAAGSIEEFALLLANQSIPRLDTFAISAGKVRARINELQASVEGMTREQAFMQAVQEEGAVAMERLGEATDDEMLAFERLEASSADLKAMLGEMLAPAVAEVTGAMADSLKATLEMQRETDRLTELFGEDVAMIRQWSQAGPGGAKQAAEAMADLSAQYEAIVVGPSKDLMKSQMEIAGMFGTTAAAADIAAEAQEGLATSAGNVARSFGEMTFDDEQLWKMALASGASLDQLGILAEQLGIATDAEIQHTLGAYKLVEAFGEGKINADELRDSFGDLAFESWAAAQAAEGTSENIGSLHEDMANAGAVAADLTGDFEDTTGALEDMETAAGRTTRALREIPRNIDIEVEYHTQGVPGMQHGGVWPGGVGWVGEGGPELAVFPRGTRIVPAWESRQMVRSTTDNRTWGAVNTTIIVQDPLAAAMVLEEKRRETTRRLRRGM